jgi:hypothetical protein
VARITVTGTSTYDMGFVDEFYFCVPSAVKMRSLMGSYFTLFVIILVNTEAIAGYIDTKRD